jgi:tRNA pseudouridine55 synthase
METPQPEGRLLLVNKPYEWTSFDVVRKLRYKLKVKKIGHAGTLDPLATGLLILCVGKMTKQIDSFMGLEKEYTGKFVIGQTTETLDLESEPTQPVDISGVTSEAIQVAAKSLTGDIEQLPPAHSAIKIKGQRAYTLAREGKEVELKTRVISISVFEITAIQLPVISFRIVCSKGTYIRSIARDFGNVLGVGAYLSELCRTRIGPHLLADAQTIEEIE